MKTRENHVMATRITQEKQLKANLVGIEELTLIQQKIVI